jgi:hypothetical protein
MKKGEALLEPLVFIGVIMLIITIGVRVASCNSSRNVSTTQEKIK